MDELMKSFGLFSDEDGYWFVTKEDHERGNFLVITYPDRIIAHKSVRVIENKIYYSNLIEVLDMKNQKQLLLVCCEKQKKN